MSDAPIQLQPDHIRSGDYREIYANSVGVRLGPFDLTLVFGQVTDNPPGTIVVEDKIAVTVSPQHMKSLVRVMTQTLESYESVFGELTIAEDATRPRFTTEELSGRLLLGRQLATPSAFASEPAPPASKSRGGARKKG